MIDLTLLREKDPATWKRFCEMPIYEKNASRLTIDLTNSGNDALIGAWLQAILQDVIQARGWASTLTYNPPRGPEAPFRGAHVWPDDRCSAGKKADSPAEALLKAYIEAIG